MLEKARGFLKEVRIELGKVTWPKRDQLWGSTGIVIVISILLAIFIGLVDLFLSRVMAALLR